MTKPYKYPKIGYTARLSKPGGTCIFCGKPGSDFRIDLQWSIFRGDDEVLTAHFEECWKKYRTHPEKLVAILERIVAIGKAKDFPADWIARLERAIKYRKENPYG